jgi:D-arabinose 1-dehydrogenase-like Zn-dependent alcohol dehydrogenase
MAKFRALLVTKDGDRQSIAATELTDADLMEGNVSIAVEHSTVNYKDGLAMTGKAPIIRKFPLIPGISVNSVFTPREARRGLGSSGDGPRFAKLNSMRLDDVPALATEVLAGKTRGRVVIDL